MLREKLELMHAWLESVEVLSAYAVVARDKGLRLRMKNGFLFSVLGESQLVKDYFILGTEFYAVVSKVRLSQRKI
ncbi:hypothetical protein Pr1d_35180 [Bythopirellula goksoeyrii]|uniref:Uncharacterized protein n=1 Tax=Bythopirellula goksoeyrii TaxID=1400387 RepID=A0A5B9QGX8_9BACT|nr:hypothetical protein Pr1d_35180 [Bythopirellula goksoeyrii]